MTTATGVQFDEDGNLVKPEKAQRKEKKSAIRKYKYRRKNFPKYLGKLEKVAPSVADEYRDKKESIEEDWDNAEDVEEKQDISKDYQNLYEKVKIEVNDRR